MAKDFTHFMQMHSSIFFILHEQVFDFPSCVKIRLVSINFLPLLLMNYRFGFLKNEMKNCKKCEFSNFLNKRSQQRSKREEYRNLGILFKNYILLELESTPYFGCEYLI